MKYFVIFFIFIINCSLIINIDKESQSHSQKIIDYSEKDWTGLCKTGDRNSPIDFPSKTSGNYKFTNSYIQILTSNYKPIQGQSFKLYNNQKFAVDVKNLGSIMIKKESITYVYDLVDMQVHIPTEHTIEGTSFDLELQLVHTKNKQYLSDQGVKVDTDYLNDMLIISILYTADYDHLIHPDIQKMNIANLAPINGLDINKFVTNRNFFHYIGSITNPPCTENVNWIVFEQSENISIAQYNDFQNWILPLYPSGNSRITKPLLGRNIYYSKFSDAYNIGIFKNSFILIFLLFILF